MHYLIANLQYGWTLFVNPMHQAHGWSLAEIQLAFAIFTATETWRHHRAERDHMGPRRQGVDRVWGRGRRGAGSYIAPIARDYGLADITLLFGASVLSIALVVDNVMNGLARPFFGWLSDQIGREFTMAIAFILGGSSYGLLAFFGHDPWAFVIAAGLVFFTWGEIFSLFPATCTDLFGTRYATANASLLYTAKGTAVWLVPFNNLLVAFTGSWHVVFLLAAATKFVVARGVVRAETSAHATAPGGARYGCTAVTVRRRAHDPIISPTPFPT